MLEAYRELRSLKGNQGAFDKERRDGRHSGYVAHEELAEWQPAGWQDPNDLDYGYGDYEAQLGNGEASSPPDEYNSIPAEGVLDKKAAGGHLARRH